MPASTDRVLVRLGQVPAPEHRQEIVKNIYRLDPCLARAGWAPGAPDTLELEFEGEWLPGARRAELEAEALRFIAALELPPVKVLFDQKALPVPGRIDPHPELKARGLMREVLPGVYAHEGLLLELLEGLDAFLRRYAQAKGARERRFSTLLSLETAQRSRYLKDFAAHANFVSHLGQGREELESFRARMVLEPPARAAAPSVAPPCALLSPTVCHHFWAGLAGERLDLNSPLAGTAMGICFRYEGRALEGLERLREFRMREFFACGSPRAMAALREELLRDQMELLSRFQLRGAIETASDPFFVTAEPTKRRIQAMFELKHEIKLALPYRDTWLAVGSVNLHKDAFSTAFGFSARDGSAVHSCCAGWGLERFALAILAQHGLEVRSWPPALQGLLAQSLSQ